MEQVVEVDVQHQEGQKPWTEEVGSEDRGWAMEGAAADEGEAAGEGEAALREEMWRRDDRKRRGG